MAQYRGPSGEFSINNSGSLRRKKKPDESSAEQSQSSSGKYKTVLTTQRNDFIILSEFSEREGPMPLHVIPKESQGSFDVNAFVLKIMQVDSSSKSLITEGQC